MKEYIDRAAVKDGILSWAICINHPKFLSKEDTMYCIDNLPAADVVEVRHGRWERNSPDDIVVYCSQCMMPQDAPSNYCPSCGALMDKEDEHEAD